MLRHGHAKYKTRDLWLQWIRRENAKLAKKKATRPDVKFQGLHHLEHKGWSNCLLICLKQNWLLTSLYKSTISTISNITINCFQGRSWKVDPDVSLLESICEDSPWQAGAGDRHVSTGKCLHCTIWILQESQLFPLGIHKEWPGGRRIWRRKPELLQIHVRFLTQYWC